ncbi:MAG: stage III sporulation protein D [Bacilli bacterium]|nr:stage III sporulation protein D [Bacilli bacterium]
MDERIRKRVKKEANYLISTGRTIREVAHYFNISKSTVHKDLQERLKIISPEYYILVREIVKKNLSLRHIKGGETTKKKYSKKVS